MNRISLHDGWTVGPKRGLFDGVDGSVAPVESVTLPHDAMLSFERTPDAPSGSHGAYFVGGAVEYHRVLAVSVRDLDLVHELVFDGVYRDAMVFVNDHFAAQSPAGYSRFSVRIDPFLVEGDNEVRVEARAHRDSRWYSGLGIHRNAYLHTGPLVHFALDGVRVSTPDIDDAGAMVVVETTVVNDGLRTSTVAVATELRAPDGSVIGASRSSLTLLAGESGVVRERLWVAEPALWGTEHPELHEARITLQSSAEPGAEVTDTETATFGIRRLQLDPRHGLRINGETVKLRGACIHHDNGVLGARSIARADERRIELLKQAGFNAIRSSHNPLSPELIDACDRLGMLVMDESFDMWAEAKSPFDYSLSFPEWWQRDLASMVTKDFNHPSVIFYSIGNEIPETGRPHGSRLGRLLAEKLHELDPTRFTTNSINGLVSVIRELPPMGGGDAPQDINNAMADMGTMMTELVASDLVTSRVDESFAATDAVGLNYGDGRYLADAERYPQRVIIGTETFSTRIHLTWPAVVANDHVIGDFTWTGWDYLGEAGIGRVDYVEPGGGFGGTSGAFPWLLAWCGDIDITGHRRPVSYYREIVFGLRSDPAIAVQRPSREGLVPVGGPWSWTDVETSWSWSLAPGTPTTVEVYSDADEVELLLNGVTQGSAAVGEAHAYRAAFTVPFAAGELVAIARTGGIETGRSVLRSAAADLDLRVTVDRTSIRATPDDLAFVTIELADAAGIVHPQADRAVRVSVAGPGVLIGLGSARPDNTEGYGSDTHSTFEGRLLAVVRPTGAGDIVVTVEADGCTSRTVVVTAGE
jgi:beta-galactosidase